jgi:multiple sugar transport system ATP-binding protein
MTSITIDNLTKVYEDDDGDIVAVEEMDLEIEDGEFIVFVGPSGCGKTTTLRCVAGLESVTDGKIQFEDTEVTDLRARDRDVAMVFQNYALYPHMSVRDNLGFPLKISTEKSGTEINRLVEEFAEMLGIHDLLGQKPGDLSGGQQQRVALGRAIIREPEVFLLDEPLSNLDAKLRSEMRTELQELQNKLGTTSVYVTHDQTEAMAMGDRIAIMNHGELQQVGTPKEVYRNPTNQFVAQFIGSPSMNAFSCTVRTENGTSTLDGPAEFRYQPPETDLSHYDDVIFGLRPEDIRLSDSGVPADVNVVEPMGGEQFVYLSMGDIDLTARVDATISVSENDSVYFDFDEEDVYLFDETTGDTIKGKTSEEIEIEMNI